jgi:hypothetical protein
MIYEVKNLSDEELLHQYIRESNKYLAGVNLKASYNSLQTLKLHLLTLDIEIERRNILDPQHAARA